MISGRIAMGGLIVVDQQEDADHLHFTVRKHGAEDRMSTPSPVPREVPVLWERDDGRSTSLREPGRT